MYIPSLPNPGSSLHHSPLLQPTPSGARHSTYPTITAGPPITTSGHGLSAPSGTRPTRGECVYRDWLGDATTWGQQLP